MFVKDSNRNVIYMLWTVVAVVIVGAAVAGFMLVRKTDQLNESNDLLNGSNLSLREQLRQAKASPSPSATPEATATPTPAATATPSPTATPKPTKSPVAAP